MPEEVTVITSHGKATHDFLLHEGRLDKLLKAIEIDKMYENNDMFSLLKKSLGMKIFVKHLALHGPKVVEMIDTKFRHDLIEYLLKLCSNITPARDLPKFEWNEQKLYSIKKNAAEKSVGLISDTKIRIKFDVKSICVCSKVLNNKSFSISSAINYNCVSKAKSYKIESYEESEAYSEDGIAIMEFEESEDFEKLQEVFKKVNVVVTSELDAQNIYDKLSGLEDKTISATKSVIILTEDGYSNIQDYIEKDTQRREEIEEELKKVWNITEKENKNEAENSETKSQVDHQSDDEEKIDFINDGEDEDEKAEDDKPGDKTDDKPEGRVDEKAGSKPDQNNDYHNCFGLDQSIQLIENIINLSEFTNKYVDDEKEKNKDSTSKLYNIYNLGKDTFYSGTHCITLGHFYKQLGMMIMLLFLSQSSIEEFLESVLTTEEDCEVLTEYILIMGNQAAADKIESGYQKAYEIFVDLISKIIGSHFKQSISDKLKDMILKKLLITNTQDCLKVALDNNVKTLKELSETHEKENSFKVSIISTIPDVIKLLLKHDSATIFSSDTNFMNIFTILLLITITFRKENEICEKCLSSVFSMISEIVENPPQISITPA